jgi:hypothetical protein
MPALRGSWGRVRVTPRWRLALACSGWLTWLGQLLPPGFPLRVLVVFGFVLICPGLALTLLLPLREAVVRWVLAVALSVSLAILLNTVLTIASNDSLPLRLAVLATITTVAAVAAPLDAARGAMAAPGKADP